MRIPAALFLLSAVWASEVAEKSGPLIWPCPPCICFHCAKPEFACTNNSTCNQASGLCEGCPVGFGGDDCKKPLCGSLFKKDRAAPEKDGQPCACDDGWDGINCNVCLRDEACPQGTVCYRGNMAVGRAYKSCDAGESSGSLTLRFARVLQKVAWRKEDIRDCRVHRHRQAPSSGRV